jgi:hypothetical protein
MPLVHFPGTGHHRYTNMIDRLSHAAVDRSLRRWNQERFFSQRSTGNTYLRDSLRVSDRANTGGAAFNIINHEYLASADGLRLKAHDEAILFRSKVRSTELAIKNHTGFDPITGIVNPILFQSVSP